MWAIDDDCDECDYCDQKIFNDESYWYNNGLYCENCLQKIKELED